MYLHADQKLSPASLAVVLVKADLPFDCIGSLPPTALRALGVDMFSPHAGHWEEDNKAEPRWWMLGEVSCHHCATDCFDDVDYPCDHVDECIVLVDAVGADCYSCHCWCGDEVNVSMMLMMV